MASDDSAIDIQALRKVYREGLFGRSVSALRGVSFHVNRGEIFGLLGPNGAGKTTLIKVLLGIVRKSAGEARLLGRPAGDRLGRRQVGYLPESHRIPAHHTGNTALEYYGALSGLSSSQIRRRRPELLRTVGLAEWGRAPVKSFSKGMLQRLGLAQALMHDPEMLILDEPTDGVDPVGRKEMRTLLQRLKAEGKTIFINSHLLQEIELVCDRVVILVRGEVQRAGAIQELTAATGDRGLVDSGRNRAANPRSLGRFAGALLVGGRRRPVPSRGFAAGPGGHRSLHRRAERALGQHRLHDAPSPDAGRCISRYRAGSGDDVMRPYWAIIKDSFREAMQSRVLLLLLAITTVLLLGLAPIGVQQELSGYFLASRPDGLERLARRDSTTASRAGPSPGKQVWRLFSDDFKARLNAKPGEESAGRSGKRLELLAPRSSIA